MRRLLVLCIAFGLAASLMADTSYEGDSVPASSVFASFIFEPEDSLSSAAFYEDSDSVDPIGSNGVLMELKNGPYGEAEVYIRWDLIGSSIDGTVGLYIQATQMHETGSSGLVLDWDAIVNTSDNQEKKTGVSNSYNEILIAQKTPENMRAKGAEKISLRTMNVSGVDNGTYAGSLSLNIRAQ